MRTKKRFGKTFYLIFLFYALTIKSVCVASSLTLNLYSTDVEEGSLYSAYYKLAALETFETVNPKDYELLFPKELGDAQGLMAPNSHLRDEILNILKTIPYKYLYSEARTEDDRISRCYISQLSSEQYNMMYIIVGKGSGDVIVAFFSGASIQNYETFGDSFKQARFEDVEETVVKINAECPTAIASGMEMSSMAINDRYWTIRMKIDTHGIGLSGLNKEQAKKMLKGVGKYQVSQVFNLNIGFKLVYTSEKDESLTIILEHEDLAEILNDTDVSSEDVLQTYIDDNKKTCPLEIEKGMHMTDVALIDGVLCHEITIDEDMYSIEQLEENNALVKQELKDLISSRDDKVLVLICKWLVKTNKDIAYIYVGNKSEKIALIIIKCEELRELLSL